MINIDGKIYCKIDITGAEDIVDSATNFSLTIKESAGNVMPVCTFTVDLAPELLDYIVNEGVDVLITLGFTQDDAKQSIWKIYNWEINKGELTAIMSIPRNFINESKIEVFNDSSVGAIRSVSSQYLDTEINVSGYSDKMKWIRSGNARNFINEVWLHSYNSGKLLMPAIIAGTDIGVNSKGIFRLNDIKDKLNAVKVSDEEGTADYLLQNQFTFSSNSGTYNNKIGEVNYNEFNQNNPSNLVQSIDIEPIFGSIINRSGYNSSALDSNTRYLNSNVHQNYHKAASYNLSQLALFGGYAKKFSIVDLYGLRPPDIINLSMPIYGHLQASEVQSGYWMVSDTFTKVISSGTTHTILKEVIVRRDSITSEAYQGTFI